MEANGLWPECLVEASAENFKGQRAMEANGRLQGSNNKSLRPECLVEGAAEDFKHLGAGTRQA